MKKFIISSDALKAATKKLGQVIVANPTLPVLYNIYCKVTKGEVELIATDLEITISYKCPAEAVDTFELLLPFDFLNKIVSVIKIQPVTVEHPSVRKARIITDNDVFEINSLQKFEDFPKLPAAPKKIGLELDSDFTYLLSKAMLTSSKDETRPAMTKACLDIQGDNINLVSTDAHCLYRHKINVDSTEKEQLLLSKKMAHALDSLDKIELSWTAKMIIVKSDKIVIWCTRHEEAYPNYNAIIPNHGPNLKLQKNDMVDALHKACISSATTKQTNIYARKEKGFINFETDDADMSRKILVKIPGDYTGDVEAIAVNAKKLLTILDQVPGQEINLHIGTAYTAILISTEEDADYLGLLMPLMIN